MKSRFLYKNLYDCGDHPKFWKKGVGGGDFYGGGSGGDSGPGEGGSGFINTAKLADSFMYGYNVQTSSSTETRTFTTSNVSPNPISKNANQNDCYNIFIKLTEWSRIIETQSYYYRSLFYSIKNRKKNSILQSNIRFSVVLPAQYSEQQDECEYLSK